MAAQFSIQDPLFQSDADLKRLRPRLIGWTAAFCLAVVAGPLTAGFLLDHRAHLTPERFALFLGLTTGAVVVAVTGFVYHVAAVRQRLKRHYERALRVEPTQGAPRPREGWARRA